MDYVQDAHIYSLGDDSAAAIMVIIHLLCS